MAKRWWSTNAERRRRAQVVPGVRLSGVGLSHPDFGRPSGLDFYRQGFRPVPEFNVRNVERARASSTVYMNILEYARGLGELRAREHRNPEIWS